MILKRDDLIHAMHAIIAIRERLIDAQVGNPEVARLIALTRTQLELAEMCIGRAADRFP